MAFPVDDIVLGPAAFGRLHRLDLLIGHTGEEPGFTRDHAIATATWQRTNPGSYSFRVYDAASAGSRGGVMLNVPYLEASGGINPNSAAWAPERHPWIERELAKAGPCPVAGCAGPYRNPTMHAGQISFVGRRDQLDAGKAPANYLPDAQRLVAWYETHPLRGPAPLVIVMHGHLQTNRSDWGTWMQSRLAPQQETDMPILTRPVRQKWRVPAGTRFWLGGPELGTQKQFTVAVQLWSNGETLDGLWRRMEYNAEELWIRRHDIKPVDGTRNPASGFGSPVLHGFSQKQLDAAERAGILNGGQIAILAFTKGGTDAAKASITKATGG